MLWSGILLFWSLIGIDLEKAKEAEGNVSTLVKSIKSPQAVPWVLLILVAYFIFKLTIEWQQCNPARRSHKVAKVDFFSAVSVAAVAYLLYFVQILSRVQLADFIQSKQEQAWSFAGGTVTGVLVLVTIYVYRDGDRSWIYGAGFTLLGFLGAMIRDKHRLLVLAGVGAAFSLWGLSRILLKLWQRRRRVSAS